MINSYILAGNKVRFRFDGFRVNSFFIVDLPDIRNLSMITFSDASIGEKHIVTDVLLQPLVVFGKGISYSDVTFFDKKNRPINSCVLLVPSQLVGDYKMRNDGYISDMFPNATSMSRCRPSNIRLLPWCLFPSEYIGSETRYLRVYLHNGDGSCEIVNTRENEYHIIEEYTKPIVMAETWIGGCSIVDTFRPPNVKMVVYDGGLLV